MNGEIPWPSEKDQLFVKPKSTEHAESKRSPEFESILESLKPELESSYREGYYEAARTLSQHICNDGRSDVVYPMLFCYRHFVELSTKSLILVYAKLQDDEVRITLPREHSLGKLWNEAKRLIKQAEPSDRKDDATLRNVERSITELNQVDKNSQLFRYATDKQGDSVESRLPKPDLQQFVTTMENLHSFFAGCEMQAEVWQEYKDEMEAYYRPDYEYWNSP